MREESFLLDESCAGQRIDKIVPQLLPELSRVAVQELCAQGRILLDAKAIGKSVHPRIGSVLTVRIPPPVEADVLPQEIPLEIVYEDDDLIVVNKPKGMVVHPAPGNPDSTLVNALLFHCKGCLSGIGGVMRPGIVHRIDKDTSGLLIIAKNDFAHQKLSEQIKAHTFTRRYETIVHGHLREKEMTVCAPIGRDSKDRKRMCVTDRNAKEATTHFNVIAEYAGFSHLQCILETGRTHQIRVHAAYIGHPVAGDTVYGPKKPAFNCSGQCLHARTIGFIHPRTGEYLEFSSELPEYFQSILKILRFKL